jgi:hypothetical protein
MLIRLIRSPADEHRSGANEMRQHLSFQEHSRRGNAFPIQIVALQVLVSRRLICWFMKYCHGQCVTAEPVPNGSVMSTITSVLNHSGDSTARQDMQY